jgi:hypothetical protein
VGAIVDARELGTTAVAVARLPGQTVVTLVGPDGTGVTGRAVTVDGTDAEPCGAGCYSTQARPGPVAVAVDGRSLTFSLPDKAPSAATLLAQVTARYRASRSIVFDERLASSPTNAIVTRFEVVSPHRLTYRIRGGPQAIVIDARRWDRSSPSSRWQESQQTPLDVTQPYWHNPTNVHLVGPNTLTFLSRDIPAWFRVTLDASHARPTFLHMTAASHFMTDTFRGYDVPVVVSPPSR